MDNNDFLRRLRYALNLSEGQLSRLYRLLQQDVSLEHLTALLKKDEEPGFRPCSDQELCQLLDGLIIDKRGHKPGTALPTPTALNNNLIFKKLRIALELKEEDILTILSLADFRLTKSELGAIFRNPDHRHFRPCGDQMLRNFLKGLAIHLRGH